MKYIIFHEDFSKRAGTERVLVNLIAFLLSDSSNSITLLLSTGPKDLVFGVDRLNIDIVFLGNRDKSGNKLGMGQYYVSLFCKLRSYMRKIDVREKTVVISANSLLSALMYVCIRNRPNYKLISCEHFSFHVAGNFSKFLRKLFYSKIFVVTLTEGDRDIVKATYNPIICACIPNAIPFEIKEYQGIESKTIISIGRYTFQKGFDLLIEAFAKIAKRFPDWKLEIVGDDYGDGALLNQLIKKYNLTNVYLTSATSNVLEIYDNAAFYVMSSRFEGLPMVLLEAMGRGLPLISFDCPTGPKEIISASNGILVNNNDISALAESMQRLIEDPQLRLRLSKGSHIRANMFHKDNINILWKNFFTDIWKK